MYRILLAAPRDSHFDTVTNPCVEAAVFFTSGQATCLISLDPEEIKNCDGVVVPGGFPDVNPKFYGEGVAGNTLVDLEMDTQQFAMIDRAFQLNKPILGICRGLQLITVYLGGTLIQDIAHKKQHSFQPENPKFHVVHNIPGTFMYDLYGASAVVNSAHHQAIKVLPDCLRVSQFWYSDDRKAAEYIRLAQAGELLNGSNECIIEAVYHKDYPFIGVQWHPEMRGVFSGKDIDSFQIVRYFYSML